VQPHAPSGLFPSVRHRPTFREPHPIAVPSAIVGAGLALAWQVLFAVFASSLRAVFWRTVAAAVIAWAVAALLLRFGGRGAAVGVALAAAVGGCVAAVIVAVRWLSVGWPLW
jgi:hypothetical protein